MNQTNLKHVCLNFTWINAFTMYALLSPNMFFFYISNFNSIAHYKMPPHPSPSHCPLHKPHPSPTSMSHINALPLYHGPLQWPLPCPHLQCTHIQCPHLPCTYHGRLTKFVVKAHDRADNWFEQSPLGVILVQEKWTKLLKPWRAYHRNLLGCPLLDAVLFMPDFIFVKKIVLRNS